MAGDTPRSLRTPRTKSHKALDESRENAFSKADPCRS